jgi:nucleotide-binding universal stress UspA family protein
MRDLKSQLDVALPDELAGVEVTRIVNSGDPALTIADFARTHGVDLVMMPTHGHGPFRSLLLGSVTGKVLHDVKCAVWTAAHAETQRASRLPRTVLCAVDATPANIALLPWAAEFSAQIGATLRLLHVVPPVSDWLSLSSEQSLQDRWRERAADKMATIQRSAGVEAVLDVAVGEIVATVTEEARQAHADLILIGRGSLQSTMGRLRTHALGIIQRAPCPVLSV